jgi:hypothetical protein
MTEKTELERRLCCIRRRGIVTDANAVLRLRKGASCSLQEGNREDAKHALLVAALNHRCISSDVDNDMLSRASLASYSSSMYLIMRYCLLSDPKDARALRRDDCS